MRFYLSDKAVRFLCKIDNPDTLAKVLLRTFSRAVYSTPLTDENDSEAVRLVLSVVEEEVGRKSQAASPEQISLPPPTPPCVPPSLKDTPPAPPVETTPNPPIIPPPTPHTNGRACTRVQESMLTDMFNGFWVAYPRKRGKESARMVFGRLMRQLDKHEAFDLMTVILRSLNDHKRSHDWIKDNGRFIPYPATWLHQRRWQDELSPSELEPTAVTEEIAGKYAKELTI